MFRLDSRAADEIKAHAHTELPNEACGYVAGRDRMNGTTVYAMRNLDGSPEHFAFDPAEQFDVLKRAREADLDLIGVYHSHPETPARMSEEDLRLLRDPGMVYLIYSVSEDRLRAFSLDSERGMIPLDIEVVSAHHVGRGADR